MVRLPLLLALLLAASAGATRRLTRVGCGCSRNVLAQDLTVTEISRIRVYIQQLGVKNYGVLSDDALRAVFRFTLNNNFHGQVPSSRSAVLQMFVESLSTLTDSVIPTQSRCGSMAAYLMQHTPVLIKGGKFDMCSLVSSAAIVMHQRGVNVDLDQLNVLLKIGLTRYLKSTIYQSSYSLLLQLMYSLDYIDHNLPQILDYEELVAVRQAMLLSYNLKRERFDNRFKLALKEFKISRARLISTINILAYRGPFYEVAVQEVIVQIIKIFPGISEVSVRIILDILQITNTAGGKSHPRDLLGMITVPQLDAKLCIIEDIYINLYIANLIKYYPDINVEIIKEAYSIYIIALASQGIQPQHAEKVYEYFFQHMTLFFEEGLEYSVTELFYFVVRVVVPMIPRDTIYFSVHIFETTVVIDNILVPMPWVNIYKTRRANIIKQIVGPQGNSAQITQRIVEGTGEKSYIQNDIQFDIIKPAVVPGYNLFEFQNVIIQAQYMKQAAELLIERFNYLKAPSLRLPLLRILVRARLISGTDAKAVASFRQLIQGLPVYQVPDDLGFVFTQINQFGLQLTEVQIRAALQQFYVVTRCLGYVIPQQSLPSVFIYSVREYLATLVSIPAYPFGDNYLVFLYRRLSIIIKQVVVVDSQEPIDDYVTQQILSVFGRIKISAKARRTIIKFIYNSKFLSKQQIQGSVIYKYKYLLKALIKRYPVDTFVLSMKELKKIQKLLSNVGMKIKLKYLRDVNILAYICLGLTERWEIDMTVIRVRQIIYSSIRYFLKTNEVTNILSLEYCQFLISRHKVKTEVQQDWWWSYPADQYIEVPEPQKPPVYILPDIELTVTQVYKLIVILQKRFDCVSMDNIRTIIVHTILIIRAKRVVITQDNCYDYLTNYYNTLPATVGIESFDINDLLSSIEQYASETTVTEVTVQSTLVELCIHLYSMNLPLPSIEYRNRFLSFVLDAYGKQSRFRLPPGARFYNFLKSFLPKARKMKPKYMTCGARGFKFFYC